MSINNDIAGTSSAESGHTPDAAAPKRNTLVGVVRLLRPKQWVKNGFVLAPLLFSLNFLIPAAFIPAGVAFLLFCAISSVAYIINDISDLESDRLHPLKCNRPLPAGQITRAGAIFAAGCCLIVAAGAASVMPWKVRILVTAYLVMNLAYSRFLKHVVILDVMILALGFVMRVLAGSWAIGISKPTTWLLVCTFLLALLIGFAKRRHELVLLGKDAGSHRKVLSKYTPQLLDAFLAAVTGACIVCYALYTLLPNEMNKYKTEEMAYTLPFVIFGLFRYLYLVYRKEKGGDPTTTLLADWGLLSTGALWATACGLILAANKYNWW